MFKGVKENYHRIKANTGYFLALNIKDIFNHNKILNIKNDEIYYTIIFNLYFLLKHFCYTFEHLKRWLNFII